MSGNTKTSLMLAGVALNVVLLVWATSSVIYTVSQFAA